MSRSGLILVVLGFIGGSLACVWSSEQINWILYGVSIFFCLVGVIILRRHQGRKMGGGATTENMRSIGGCLQRLADNASILRSTSGSLTLEQIYQKIDEDFPEDLSQFVDNRKSIIYRHGMQAYADVMTEFAAGERYLNRVWSAAVDGYSDEVKIYMAKVEAQFSAAQVAFAKLS